MGVLAEFSPGQRQSGELAGDWHAQAGHDVHDLTADGRFKLLRGQSPSAEAASEENLVPEHCDFDESAPSITAAAPFGDVAMLRYKTLIGRSLHARILPRQKTEAKVACKVINIVTGLGMPMSRRVT